MVWKNLARIAAAGAEAVGRAFARAVKEELNASKQAASRQTQQPGTSAGSGSGSARSTSTQQQSSRRASEQQRKAMELNARLGITLQESMQILEVKPPLDAEEIRRRYDHLFAVNDKQKGGTLYLQAKIYRAKERLDAELARLEQEKKEKEEEKKSTSVEEEEQRKRDE